MRNAVLVVALLIPQVGFARDINLHANAVADLSLASGVASGSLVVDQIPNLVSSSLPVVRANMLSRQIEHTAQRISGILGLSAPGPLAIFADDKDRPGYSAVDGGLAIAVGAERRRGVIVVGSTFTDRLLSKLDERVNAAGVSAAVAHELAHIYQFRAGFWNRLLEVEGNRSRKRAELHADFLTGWIVEKLSILGPSEVALIAGQMFDMGDYEANDPNHHGTPGQRFAVLLRGYYLAKENSTLGVAAVAEAGERFVNNIVPLPAEQ